MKCPFCGKPNTRVMESRETDAGAVIRRRRACDHCDNRFTTYERALDIPLVVLKKNGHREAFDVHKVQMGMQKACEKRPISQDRIQQAAEEIELDLRNGTSSEVSSREVGDRVMEKLRAMDDVAYVRFASVYQEFDDAKKFAEVLAVLSGADRRKKQRAKEARG